MLASLRYPPIMTDGSLERQSWPTARCSWRLLKGGSMSATGRDPLSLPAGSYTLRTSPTLPSCWQPSRRPHGLSSAGSWSRTRRIRRNRGAGTGKPNGMIPWLCTAPRTPRPTSSRPPFSSRYLPRRRPSTPTPAPTPPLDVGATPTPNNTYLDLVRCASSRGAYSRRADTTRRAARPRGAAARSSTTARAWRR